MEIKIKSNANGTTSIKLDNKEINGSVKKLSLVMEPLKRPTLNLELMPEKLLIEGEGYCKSED